MRTTLAILALLVVPLSGCMQEDTTSATTSGSTTTSAEDPRPTSGTLSLTSNGAAREGVRSYTVASGSPSLQWRDLALRVDGAPLSAVDACSPSSADAWGRCYEGNTPGPTAEVRAGSVLSLPDKPGARLEVFHAPSGKRMLALTM